MTKSTVEQNAAAAAAATDTRENSASAKKATLAEMQTVNSTVIIFDSSGIPKVESDGDFELTITGEDVTGTHSHPASHKVTGQLKAGIITLDSEDGKRTHAGVLIGKTYIGRRKPNKIVDKFEQEEGVWVGTKVG